MSSLLAAMSAAGDLAYEWDLASDVILWQGPVCAALSLTDAAAVTTGRAFAGRINPEDLPARQHCLNLYFETGEAFDCEFRFRGHDGRFNWIHDRGCAERGKDGRPLRVRGVMRIAGASLAGVGPDELTGEFNRGQLHEALARAIAQSAKRGVDGAYLVVGIDNMTLINDGFGAAAGDGVIAEVARRLARTLRGRGVLGRIAGDRFGLIVPGCREERLPALAEELLESASELPIFTAAGPVYLTLSIGGVDFPRQAGSAQDAMARAETALLDAKRAGRDCFAGYRLTEKDRREHRANMAVGARVQRALKQKRLLFAFQPVVSGQNGTVDYYECLLRLREEDGTVAPAGQFVPLIEQLGFIRSIDRFVLEKAIEELAAGTGFHLGINISGLTATDPVWLRALVAQLGGRAELARRIIVEITETAALRDLQESARFVTELRELGCRVALDDFGAGFTSLRQLQELGVDTVKIDGSFVRTLAHRPESRAFLRHLIGLTGGLGLKTVAECVETAEEAQILLDEGIDLMQGYHFGRPNTERPWTPEDAAQVRPRRVPRGPRVKLRSAV